MRPSSRGRPSRERSHPVGEGAWGGVGEPRFPPGTSAQLRAGGEPQRPPKGSSRRHRAMLEEPGQRPQPRWQIQPSLPTQEVNTRTGWAYLQMGFPPIMNNSGICTGDGEQIRKWVLRNSGNIPAVEACQVFFGFCFYKNSNKVVSNSKANSISLLSVSQNLHEPDNFV